MSKVFYKPWKFGAGTVDVLAACVRVTDDYLERGYTMTVRQLYYQLVQANIIANSEAEYQRVIGIVTKGRLAGLIDWDAIEDRTRNVVHPNVWRSPTQILRAAATSYAEDLWSDQPVRVELWIEKEALAGVAQRPAEQLAVPFFSCRGYVSKSEMRAAGLRFMRHVEQGQRVVVLHFGDHDPSGIDMTRDITDQLRRFLLVDWLRDADSEHVAELQRRYNDGQAVGLDEVADTIAEHLADHGTDEPWFEVRRIALNMDQIEEYGPPPNPAKMTDSRAAEYVATHGRSSWELDSLPPDVLEQLMTDTVLSLRDDDLHAAAVERQERQRARIQAVVDTWEATP